MDAKMGMPQPHSYPGSDPPPYSGPAHGPSHSGYPYPATNQPQVTVVGTTVMPAAVIVTHSMMAPGPTQHVCPSCRHQIVTRVERIPSWRTHMFAALLCLFGCWPCVCIPYCVDSCNNAEHYCPNCNAYIGSYSG